MARALLESGADPNGTTELGTTALHELPSQEAVNLLVRYGANVNAKDNQGQTPLDLAYKQGNLAAAEHLKKLGARSAKYRSKEDAEQKRYEEQARGIYMRAASGGGSCSIDATSSGTMFSSEGGQWATVVGAKLNVSVSCPRGGAIHWVLMKNSGDVVVGGNRLLAGGRGAFEMQVTEPSGGDPILFFVSDGLVGNLAKAVEQRQARFAGRVTLTAGTLDE